MSMLEKEAIRICDVIIKNNKFKLCNKIDDKDCIAIETLIEASEKKNKIIDEMAKRIDILNNTDNMEEDCFIPREISNIDNCIKTDCKECIKQYFEKKVDEE